MEEYKYEFTENSSPHGSAHCSAGDGRQFFWRAKRCDAYAGVLPAYKFYKLLEERQHCPVYVWGKRSNKGAGTGAVRPGGNACQAGKSSDATGLHYQ